VNPHAPYEPPPPYDTAFLDAEAAKGPNVGPVAGFHGGIPKEWFVPGRDRLGWYVAQYDGEIAAVDREVGEVLDALAATPAAARTVVVLSSDHGESLGEHGYYLDHGENLFDPCLRVPLILAGPGVKGGHRSPVLASTLDIVPTVLDAVKVSYPPDLVGESLWRAARGEDRPARARLYSQNDRNLLGSYDRRLKIVATPQGEGTSYALYDREADPTEGQDVARRRPDALRVEQRELELLRERLDAETARTRDRLEGRKTEEKHTPAECEMFKSLGYVVQGC
jgi:arylsulfatase A-like enzyme